MIRKQVGDEFWLIAQNDHAIVSGELASCFGGGEWACPDARTIQAATLHDCGWAMHDDQPTLNRCGFPLDVFETPWQIGLKVWTESARRAAELDPYVGLLVSLHSLWLSVMATTASKFVHERFDLSDRMVRFEINKFQQAQVELQERLRRALGMRTDEPRRFGLAERSNDARERQLIFDFRLLQAMDKLSLAVCCTSPPAETIEPLLNAPHGPNCPLRARWRDAAKLEVSPWPFTRDQIRIRVPIRRLPAISFMSDQVFREALGNVATERFDACIVPG